MNKIVSVAMATYNGEKYLKEQLDSIYNQTFKNFEVVVVDDLSNDDTLSILKSYSINYGLKYYVNEENLGVTKNFEKAISMCCGEFILLSDQDDIWRPNKIEILLKNIGDNSLIYSNAEIINGTGKSKNLTAEDIYPLYGLDSGNFQLFKFIVLNSFILGCSTMFKRDLVRDLLPIFDSNRNHDWWLTYCAYKNNGIKYIDEILISYRHHNNNYSITNEKLSFYKKIVNFYSKERVCKRQDQIIQQNKIILFLLNNNLFSSENEKKFLSNIKELNKSYFNSKIHFKAFFFSLKYKKYLFYSKSKIENKLHLISRLIG